MPSKKPKIKNIITRSLIISSLATLAIALIGSIYFNRSSLQMLRENNLKRENELLSNFLVPALSIGDMMEVRRLLSLASDNNEKFAVIDISRNILIPNYDDFYLLKKILIPKSEFLDCSMVKTGYQVINGGKYWIHCSPLITSDLDNKHLVGLFISYSSYIPLWVSSLVFYFFSLAMLILLLNAIWFRRLLKKRLLNPLTVLGRKIIEISRSPFNSSNDLDDIEYLPHEINEIKNAFKDVLIHLQAEYQHHTESEKKSALIDQAARVVHDIRSPIAAMETSLYLVSQKIPDENMAIMKVAVQSIRDIANNLLDKYRNNQQTEKSFSGKISSIDDQGLSHPILLFSLIEEVTSQKRYEWMKNRCDLIFTYASAAKSIWLNVVPSDIKRMVSNLLNNAIEACAFDPKIEVYLDKVNTSLELKITDNGVGMRPAKIADFLNGESSKHTGKGLGLIAAKEYMNSVKGTLSVISEINVGTTISLSFFIDNQPIWCPDRILLSQCEDIVVLDDDTAMQALWFHRLQLYSVKIHLFSEYEEAFQWVKDNEQRLDKIVFLIDYELSNQSLNGLSLLEHFNVKKQGYLITSHAEEVSIQKKISEMGARLIPKVLAGDISIDY